MKTDFDSRAQAILATLFRTLSMQCGRVVTRAQATAAGLYIGGLFRNLPTPENSNPLTGHGGNLPKAALSDLKCLAYVGRPPVTRSQRLRRSKRLLIISLAMPALLS